ncbi:hypothetical protein Vretimale_18201 [Volvox reticuliferus]|uniref:SRCR domain-containing protein n=1 Tax=Volvox reticuliferus TaxID=1737510 RepID=A0A8J4CUX7_9CHLO|nr:hypothetical protein Vretifemale_17975 [Volvox reticuliferus]GIM15429.1 hypothetical protein Vretimale_18201 [Volvox reticuliferus]
MGSQSMGIIPIAVLLLISTSGGFAQLKYNRFKNGVRLQGGERSVGRIELSSVNSWFNDDSVPVVKPAWNAVCDRDFTEELAQIMCVMLGYSYGRKAYDPKFTYRKETFPDGRIGKIFCTPQLQASRGLRGVTTEMEATLSETTVASRASRSLIGDRDPRVTRSLYEPLRGTLNTSPRAPYMCTFRGGSCDTRGPLAGIQCSHTPLPPDPPLPPSPSPPPMPAFPPPSNYIKLVGGRPVDKPDEGVERNLACDGDVDCGGFGRLELQVPSTSAPNTTIWAPVCAINDSVLAMSVSYIACMQLFDWPDPRDGMIVMVPDLNTAFKVPTGPVSTSSHFNATKYNGWITITGGGPEPFMPEKVQDFNHTVSTTPCRSLLGVQCQVFNTLHRH